MNYNINPSKLFEESIHSDFIYNEKALLQLYSMIADNQNIEMYFDMINGHEGVWIKSDKIDKFSFLFYSNDSITYLICYIMGKQLATPFDMDDLIITSGEDECDYFDDCDCDEYITVSNTIATGNEYRKEMLKFFVNNNIIPDNMTFTLDATSNQYKACALFPKGKIYLFCKADKDIEDFLIGKGKVSPVVADNNADGTPIQVNQNTSNSLNH